MGTIGDRDLEPAMWNELLELFGHQGMAEMLDTLQRDLELQQRRLAEALAAEDREAFKRLAHSLGGVASQFGAVGLAQDCGDIERSVAGPVPTARIGADTTRMLDRYMALLRGLRTLLSGA